MRLVYFGSSEFAVPALRAVSDSVVLVVTQPPKPIGRKKLLTPTPVEVVARELGLSVETPPKARASEFVELVQNMNADALLVASYGQILSEKLLGASRQGGINLHASLLPKYRGAAPIQRAILDGELETGITLMQMDKGLDTGDMIATQSTRIGETETAGELESRLGEIAAAMAIEWMPRICSGEYTRAPQDDSLATYAAKMTHEDGAVSLSEPSEIGYRRYRACTPKPGAFLKTRYGALGLIAVALGSKLDGKPGVVIVESGKLFLHCHTGSLELQVVRPEGRSTMKAIDWINGLRLKSGDNLL